MTKSECIAKAKKEGTFLQTKRGGDALTLEFIKKMHSANLVMAGGKIIKNRWGMTDT